MRGCFKSKWPELLHQPEDLARAMGWSECREQDEASEKVEPLLEALDPYMARSFDDIVAAMDWGRNATRKALLEAELSGQVRAWSGDRFTRTSR